METQKDSSESKSRDISDKPSSSDLQMTINSSSSKTILIPVKDDKRPSSRQNVSRSEEPIRNSDILKRNIDRLNETLFKRTFKLKLKSKPEEPSKEEEVNQKEMSQKIINKVKNTKKKLKSEYLTRETKMQRKLDDFKKLDTFLDIQKFLKDINILDDADFKEFLGNLRKNMKEIRIKKPLAVEKNEILEKMQPTLARSRRKIDNYYSQNPKKIGFSSVNSALMKYLIADSEKPVKIEESELEALTTSLKDKLLNFQVISKNEEELKKLGRLGESPFMTQEEFAELEEIKVMLSRLGISLDDKNSEVFDNKSSDAYFKTYKQTADRLRIYMDRIVKESFKRKWIESHNLTPRKSSGKTMFESKSTQFPNINHKNQDSPAENTPFLTSLDENKPENRKAKAPIDPSSMSLQTKVKKKLERLMNSKSIFPFVGGSEEQETKPFIRSKMPKSLTYSAALINQKNERNRKESASIISHEIPAFMHSSQPRKKAQTMHVKFETNPVRKSILEFNKISMDVLKEHQKSLRKSRKSVYLPVTMVTPDIHVDLKNVKKFNQMMTSIHDRNQMVKRFQSFLSYVENINDNYLRKTQKYQNNMNLVFDDMDILQEKMSQAPIESIRDDVYTNEYVENRNKWFKKKMHTNLKNTIRLVLSQSSQNNKSPEHKEKVKSNKIGGKE